MHSLELIQDVSILIGIWVAIYGIDSWRREHTGRRQLEVAEETLALFYEARDAIHHIRHPASFSNETEDIERSNGESEQAWRARKNASVVFKRYNNYQELFGKLQSIRYRFMALFGKEKVKPFDDIKGIVAEITVAARMLARLWARDHFPTEESANKHQESIERNEAKFWEGLADTDPINPKLDALIAQIEETCSAIIQGNGTLYNFLNRPRVLKNTRFKDNV